jgi:hypothetical protein
MFCDQNSRGGEIGLLFECSKKETLDRAGTQLDE